MQDKLALVFSGGGAKGAFGVGVLGGMLEAYPDLRWQIVSGTSTGSLIAPFATLAAGRREYYEQLRELYRRIRRRDILRPLLSPLKLIKVVFTFDLPDGAYSFDPLRRLIDQYFTPELLAALAEAETILLVNAVSLQTGRLMLCTQPKHRGAVEGWFARNADRGEAEVEFVDFADLPLALLGASAIPAAIGPVAYGEHLLIDGGVLDIAPLRAAIAAGATHILSVLMSPRSTAPSAGPYHNLLHVGQRAFDLMTDEIVRNDVKIAQITTCFCELARLLLEAEGELPAATRTWLTDHGELMSHMAGRRILEVQVIEPEVHLGDGLDFDAQHRRGWPDRPEEGPLGSIMDARFEYGRRLIRRRLEEDPDLRRMLASFSAPSEKPDRG